MVNASTACSHASWREGLLQRRRARRLAGLVRKNLGCIDRIKLVLLATEIAPHLNVAALGQDGFHLLRT